MSNNKNANASDLINAVLAAQEAGSFNRFAQHLAETQPTVFIKAIAEFTDHTGKLFKVVLYGPTTHEKIKTIKFLRTLTGRGLAESKRDCEAPSVTLETDLTYNKAEAFVHTMNLIWTRDYGYDPDDMAKVEIVKVA